MTVETAIAHSQGFQEHGMTGQIRKAAQFRALHIPGKPLVLFNIWDVGSARAVAGAGAKAIATSSWSVAHANGYDDREQTPLDLAIDNLQRIVCATDLPVSIDLESGYGATAEEVGSTVRLAIKAGAVGCNLEDSIPASGKLRDAIDQAERIRIARRAADEAKVHFFINGRTDVFFQNSASQHDDARLAEASPLPINVMVVDFTSPLSALAEQGVARVSHGPRPYLLAMKVLEEAARDANFGC
jgi:2-methylisocitrate lyase-like PEP mutase family enzyme